MEFIELSAKTKKQIKADIEYWKYVGAVMKVIDTLMLSLVCNLSHSGLKKLSAKLEIIHEKVRDFRYNDSENVMFEHLCHGTLHVSPEYLQIIGGSIGNDGKDDPNVQFVDADGYINIRIKKYNFLEEER